MKPSLFRLVPASGLAALCALVMVSATPGLAQNAPAGAPAPPPASASGLSAVSTAAGSAAKTGSAASVTATDPSIKYEYKGPGPLNGVELPKRVFNNIPPRL
jgi:hypothetical protein